MHRYTFKLNHSLSIWAAQSLSILVTIIISICLLSAVSLLLLNGVLKDASIKYIIMIIHFISCFIGCLFTVKTVNGKIILHSAITTIGYILINAFTKIIVGGKWRKEVFFIYAVILIAYVTSCLITINRKNKKVRF